jgi:carboxylesterase
MTHNQFIKNAHLPGDDFLWRGNQTGVLLIHGFTATTAEVRPLAEILHQAGYTTAGPLLPGHGTHPEDMNQSTWAMWLEKVDQTYAKLRSACDHIFVVGESMGALLAMAIASQNPEVAGLLLFAPAIKINKLWQTRFLAPFIPYLEKPSNDDGLPWKGYTVNPLKAATQLLKLQKHVRKGLSKISQPTRVFTGENDQTIAPESANIILEGIQSEDKRHIHMAESAHCILLDKELDQVAEQVIAFINSQGNQQT